MIAFVLPAIVAFVGETFLVLTCLVFSDKLYNNKAMYMMFRAEKNYYCLIVVIHALLPVDFTGDVFA